jgi:hypothetical protein
MAFNVSTGAAYAVLYSILITFTLLAFASVGWFDAYLPPQVTSWFVLKHGNDGTPDYFLSARNSAGPAAIALSFFASGMGAWVLYGTTEMGATPRLSWLGVLGYSGASAFPALLICWLGPKVRAMSEEDAFSTTDFGRRRYGRVMQCTIAAVSIFYMFIFIVAELTAISAIFADLTNTYTKIYGVGISISLGIFTILYTSGTSYHVVTSFNSFAHKSNALTKNFLIQPFSLYSQPPVFQHPWSRTSSRPSLWPFWSSR